MKQTVSIFLLLVLTLRFMSLPLAYLQQRRMHELAWELIKENLLGEKDVVELNMSVQAYENLEWLEEGKEFVFQGRLYDVLDIKIADGHAQIKCYDDSRESAARDAGRQHHQPIKDTTFQQWASFVFVLPEKPQATDPVIFFIDAVRNPCLPCPYTYHHQQQIFSPPRV